MTAASGPRGAAARLLVVGDVGRIAHRRAHDLPSLVRAGDVVVANDAATLPASLAGEHEPTAAAIEVRLAGRRSLAWQRVRRFVAVVFGAGDHRTPTEQRPLPPAAARRRSASARPARRRRRARARASAADRAGVRGIARARLERHRQARASDPVRARAAALGHVVYMDADRQPAGGVRAAIGRLRARLGHGAAAARSRCDAGHADPRRRDLVDRRRGPGCPAAARRALPDSRGHRRGDRRGQARMAAA